MFKKEVALLIVGALIGAGGFILSEAGYWTFNTKLKEINNAGNSPCMSFPGTFGNDPIDKWNNRCVTRYCKTKPFFYSYGEFVSLGSCSEEVKAKDNGVYCPVKVKCFFFKEIAC